MELSEAKKRMARILRPPAARAGGREELFTPAVFTTAIDELQTDYRAALMFHQIKMELEPFADADGVIKPDQLDRAINTLLAHVNDAHITERTAAKKHATKKAKKDFAAELNISANLHVEDAMKGDNYLLVYFLSVLIHLYF